MNDAMSALLAGTQVLALWENSYLAQGTAPRSDDRHLASYQKGASALFTGAGRLHSNNTLC